MEPFGALATEVVDANSLKNMVGPWGLGTQTSTVSKTECPAVRCPCAEVSGRRTQMGRKSVPFCTPLYFWGIRARSLF